ncbi:3'-5' exonuclease [Gymnodinialimonas hymeniacidonis]|uniref:3'-5' exonuclease n=1 Tax=Gymnodinialimonas hymeniacidonis TaxID=3126508 RepID=UPI0034C5C88A
MLTLLSLRLRIFLFFCLLALGGAAVAVGAIWFGVSRGDPFLTSILIFIFLNTGLILGIWLLFDENVAKPILNMSAQLRLHAHALAGAGVDMEEGRYLGDLAPAADALSARALEAQHEADERVAAETERLAAERARLTAILSDIPMAVILLNDAEEIVLYDSQAAQALSRIAPPRLKARLTDYFDPAPIAAAMQALQGEAYDVALRLSDAAQTHVFHARLKAQTDGGYMVVMDLPEDGENAISARPLVYDFDLLIAETSNELADTPLDALCYVAFDTETTGLSVEADDIIQIGAVRVLRGRMVEGETVDTYVGPDRPIPPASTKIHKITDADVTGAPDIASAGRMLSHFAHDAVLVAHNAPFDIGLLRKSATKMGVEWTHPVLDTVLLSAVVFGTNAEHSLDALCDRLGVEIAEDRRHTALGDAEATAKALVCLLPLLKARGVETFGQLIEQTRKHGRLLQDLNG